MKISEARALVDSLSYKPGTTFQFMTDFGSDELRVKISMHVWNVWDPTDTTRLDGWLTLPGYADRDEVLAMIYTRVVDMETHEAAEFFKVNGQCYRDPHPEMTQAAKDAEYESYKRHKAMKVQMDKALALEKTNTPPFKPPRPRQMRDELYGFQDSAVAMMQSMNDSRLTMKGLADTVERMLPPLDEKTLENLLREKEAVFLKMDQHLDLPPLPPDPKLERLKDSTKWYLTDRRVGKGYSNKHYERFRPKTRRD